MAHGVGAAPGQFASGSQVVEADDLRIWFPIKAGFLRRTVGHVKAVDGVTPAMAGLIREGLAHIAEHTQQLMRNGGGRGQIKGAWQTALIGSGGPATSSDAPPTPTPDPREAMQKQLAAMAGLHGLPYADNPFET